MTIEGYKLSMDSTWLYQGHDKSMFVREYLVLSAYDNALIATCNDVHCAQAIVNDHNYLWLEMHPQFRIVDDHTGIATE